MFPVSTQSTQRHIKFVFSVANMESGRSGEFIVELHPEWAPLAAARFEKLVEQGFFDGSRFFRVVSGFIAQFGLAGDPAVTASWDKEALPEEERKVPNKRGRMAFAFVNGKERSPTQIVINSKDNPLMDQQGLVPFAEVSGGMAVIDRLYGWYGAGKTGGRGPQENSIKEQGNAYLEANFPKLSYITSVRRVEQSAPPQPAKHPEGGASRLIFAMGAFLVTLVAGGGWMTWTMNVLPAKHVCEES